ncbi:MAG: phosphoribosylanthranilate isomerase [Candidatus Acidiferrales bacterium]
MVRVKICGITNWTDARRAVEVGADALGFNFYEKSPRYIAPPDARVIAKRLPRRILLVGVFVNAGLARALQIARDVDLNVLQLHGEESPADVEKLSGYYPVVKAFRVSRGFQLQRLRKYGDAHAFLLDGFDRERKGGTGKTFDWQMARAARKYGATIIAGGLNPENIVQAIAEAKPFGVDVCGGVESSPGKKDHALLFALMAAVARARGAAA